MIEGASDDNDEKNNKWKREYFIKEKYLYIPILTPVVEALVIRHVGKQVKS